MILKNKNSCTVHVHPFFKTLLLNLKTSLFNADASQSGLFESVETSESVLGSVDDSCSSLGVDDPTVPFTDNGAESEGQLLLAERGVGFHVMSEVSDDALTLMPVTAFHRKP